MPKPPSTTFISVPAALAGQVKIVANAMTKHWELDSLAGAPHHFLAHAALATRPVIGEEAFQKVLVLNKDAGRAKHCLARVPAASGGASSSSAVPRWSNFGDSDPGDPLHNFDPWAAAASLLPAGGDPNFVLNAEAAAFTPCRVSP